jgi:hypothetical protein
VAIARCIDTRQLTPLPGTGRAEVGCGPCAGTLHACRHRKPGPPAAGAASMSGLTGQQVRVAAASEWKFLPEDGARLRRANQSGHAVAFDSASRRASCA